MIVYPNWVDMEYNGIIFIDQIIKSLKKQKQKNKQQQPTNQL